MRALLIAVALVVGLGGSAEAGKGGAVVINTGDDIFHVRNLTPDETTQFDGFGKLGYRYDLFGVFWMDVWRWGGEFVVYSDTTYSPITDDELAQLGGASVPWRYHLPPGLLIILAGIELAIITRTRRTLKTTLVVGGVLLGISAAFYLMGLDWEFLIPAFLAGHHLIGAYASLKLQREREAEGAVAAEVMRASAAHAASADDEADDEQRYAPRPSAIAREPARAPVAADSRPSQPIVVERPPTAPAAVPMRADDSVDGPKLLR